MVTGLRERGRTTVVQLDLLRLIVLCDDAGVPTPSLRELTEVVRRAPSPVGMEARARQVLMRMVEHGWVTYAVDPVTERVVVHATETGRAMLADEQRRAADWYPERAAIRSAELAQIEREITALRARARSLEAKGVKPAPLAAGRPERRRAAG